MHLRRYLAILAAVAALSGLLMASQAAAYPARDFMTAAETKRSVAKSVETGLGWEARRFLEWSADETINCNRYTIYDTGKCRFLIGAYEVGGKASGKRVWGTVTIEIVDCNPGYEGSHACWWDRVVAHWARATCLSHKRLKACEHTWRWEG